jgi:rhodanese-related sulfurtransferase
MQKVGRSFAFLVVLVALIGGAAACHTAEEPRPSGVIGADDLARRIATGNAPLVLDVRTAAEFATGHIPGAINIPHSEIPGRLGELTLTRSDDVVVYCRSGRRAAMAGVALRAAGYTNVHDLEGHMQGWLAVGHPVEK